MQFAFLVNFSYDKFIDCEWQGLYKNPKNISLIFPSLQTYYFH